MSCLPAHLAGALAEPKRLLVEDHLRECVPCRRALAELRRGGAGAAATPAARPSRRWQPGRLALAATLAGLMVGAAWMIREGSLFAPEVHAKVRSIEGELVAVDHGRTRPVSAGDTIREGESVRTAAGSGAVLELADGSRLELGERAELALDHRRDGAVADLASGALIVEAAEQKRGHLYVRTADCEVSVVGTIFSVQHGVRGSRVSVLDGEVHVAQGARLAVLRPGDQLATNAQLDARLARAGDRLEPERAGLSRAHRGARGARPRARRDARRARHPHLDEAARPGAGRHRDLGRAAQRLRPARGRLVARSSAASPRIRPSRPGGTSGSAPVRPRRSAPRSPSCATSPATSDRRSRSRSVPPPTGSMRAPLLLAEIADPSGFDALVDDEIAKMNARAGQQGKLVRVTDPAVAAAAVADGTLLVWSAPSGLLVATPSSARLQEFAAQLAAGTSSFAATSFHARMASAYADGAGWLLGIDRSALAPQVAGEPGAAEAFAALGFADAQQFVLESETVEGVNETRATLGFSGERHGMASWLAAPAPSRALEFVSPDAQLVVAGLAKSPAAMFDDLLAVARAKGNETAAAKVAEIEGTLGLSLRDDLAASFGGDFAVALDGPVLPKPSWKVVVELVDPSRFDFALGRLIEAANAEAAKEGKPGLRLAQEEADGRLFRHLSTEAGADLAYLTEVDGYLLIAPSRALIVDAIARRAAGAHLAASRAFLDRLPSDADPDFSALVWQNLGGIAGSLGQLFGGGNVPPEAQAEIEAMTRDAGPTLIVAYGEPDRVRLVARGAHGPLGFSFERLLALAGALRSGTGEPASEPVADETPARATA